VSSPCILAGEENVALREEEEEEEEEKVENAFSGKFAIIDFTLSWRCKSYDSYNAPFNSSSRLHTYSKHFGFHLSLTFYDVQS
jgi:hypothetical protein